MADKDVGLRIRVQRDLRERFLEVCRIARQSGWERRDNQDESRRPSGIIDAGSQNGKSDCVGKV
jgi:hypothetical protein